MTDSIKNPMSLLDIVQQTQQRADTSVPDWMLGCFRRRSISFANGETDDQTIVYWLQSRNFTIDLRLPLSRDQVPPVSLSDCTEEQLNQLANYEGWVAESEWDGTNLSWHGGTSLQLHNRWPEPAELRRVGNCMIEFAASGAYVEDWRLQASQPGPLIGLRLLEQRNLHTGELQHEGGGLIICGDHAALVLGRKRQPNLNETLPAQVAEAQGDLGKLQMLLGVETSVGTRSEGTGYSVEHSTTVHRVGEPLVDLNNFEFSSQQTLRQLVEIDGATHERIFSIDTLEPEFNFTQATATTSEAQNWLSREAGTLTRYTRPMFW